jgi:hypothetical protein
MNARRNFLLLVTVAAAAATPALGQTAAPTAGAASSGTHGPASIPDFSGIWWHPSLPGFEPPASGPGPVTNRSRHDGVSDYGQLVGDYTNPILQPWAAEVVKKKGELSLAGVTYPNPANQCWPEPVPFIYKNFGLQMLQQPDRITMLYEQDHEVRYVRMNQPHPAHVKPSWYGDSVGHYEGDTLVIDTVGTRTDRPFAMIDLYGTPYTKSLHVVERYRLLDYEVAKDGLERDAKENFRPPPRWASTAATGASICSFYSRSRMKASSLPHGRRPSLSAAAPTNGRKPSAPKTSINTISTRTPRSRPRTGRISERRQ